MEFEETEDLLARLKASLDSYITYQEASDQQMEDIIDNPELFIFHKYDFYLLTFISLNPEFLTLVVERPTKFIDAISNALINYQRDQIGT